MSHLSPFAPRFQASACLCISLRSHRILSRSSCQFEAATNRLPHHENSHREEVLDRAALRRRRKEEEEGKVAEDVDCCDSQENEAEGQRCRNEDGEVYEHRT